MVERVAAVDADGLAACGAGVEHENGAGRRVGRKDFEHPSLIVGLQVEKAVPGQHAVVALAEHKRTHVPNDPALARHPFAAQRDQRRRGVDAGDPQPARRQRRRDGIAPAAPEVEHGPAGGQQTDEQFDPGAVDPGRRPPIGVPLAGVAFVVVGDQIGEGIVRHHLRPVCRMIPCPPRSTEPEAMGATTIFLGKLLGLYMVAIAAGMLVNHQRATATIDEMARSGPWMLFSGLVATAAGLAMVLEHEVWRGGALPVLVSATGWAALLKGLTLLLVPGERVAGVYRGAGFERYFRVWMVGVLTLGAWMAWLAFMA